MTEHFMTQLTGRDDSSVSYRAYGAIFDEVSAIVGDDVMRAAYFDGDAQAISEIMTTVKGLAADGKFDLQ